jgi:hypothetical protein
MTRDGFGDTSIQGIIILKWTLQRHNKKVWIRYLWLTEWKSGRSHEHGNESSDSITFEEFLEQLKNF